MSTRSGPALATLVLLSSLAVVTVRAAATGCSSPDADPASEAVGRNDAGDDPTSADDRGPADGADAGSDDPTVTSSNAPVLPASGDPSSLDPTVPTGNDGAGASTTGPASTDPTDPPDSDQPSSPSTSTTTTAPTVPEETSTTSLATTTTVGSPGTGVVGQRPDGAGNPAGVCADGVIQAMADDAPCGYADIGGYCVAQINHWRAQQGLEPFVRLEQYEACASREARLALEAGRPHFDDDCGWQAQASSGGGRGGDGSPGTIEKSVWWLPKLIYDEGPNGGHYQGMMTERVRGVSCGYYARDRDQHRIIINYYDL